jgi:molecular chaperone DnaJ
MPALEKDYYEILGIPRDADEQAIKKAYHNLAMQWHPDRNKSLEAEDRFKEIAMAYAILKDPQKRTRYDAQGMEGVAHYSSEDLFGNLDLGHIFGDMGFAFGGGDSIFDRMFSHSSTRPPHGQDLRVPIEIPLKMINDGGKQELQVSHPVACSSCHGYGTKTGTPPPLCISCHGSGRIVSTRSESKGEQQIKVQQIKACPICHGKGNEITDLCSTCGGYGQVEKEETIKVTIPPGIEDGMVLRIAGHGLPAEEADIPSGDLHVVVSTKADNHFQRRGPDLWRAETIAVPDAVLGTSKSIPGLSDNIELTIPPGTQPDEIIQLKSKGLPRFRESGRGDINIRIQVDIPDKLSQKERKLYEQLREFAAVRHKK